MFVLFSADLLCPVDLVLTLSSPRHPSRQVAGGFLARISARDDAAALLAPWSPAEEKKLLRWKIDPIIMTLVRTLHSSPLRH